MSEPYIRFWAADMRGDPEMLVIGLAGQALLAHAWDLAKNGPQCPDLRMPNGKPMKSGQFSALIPGSSRSQCARFFGQILDLNLAEKTTDGALTFPKMPHRQGIDMTATMRQRRRRLRLKQQEDVTAESRSMSRPESRPSHGDVTGQSTDYRTGKKKTPDGVSSSPPSPRKRDPIWDAFVDALGLEADLTKTERGRLNSACKELRDLDVDPREIGRVVARLREKWEGRIAITPTAVVANWTATLAELNPNGQQRQWTREDFDRIAEARERVANAQREAALARAAGEDDPY